MLCCKLTLCWHDAQVCEIVKKEDETRQAEWSLVECSADLRSSWQEMDYYEAFQAHCTPDASA